MAIRIARISSLLCVVECAAARSAAARDFVGGGCRLFGGGTGVRRHAVLVDQVAGDQVALLDLAQMRLVHVAVVDCERAARREVASRRRVDRARRIALQGDTVVLGALAVLGRWPAPIEWSTV